jgi:hypothetical protein
VTDVLDLVDEQLAAHGLEIEKVNCDVEGRVIWRIASYLPREKRRKSLIPVDGG